MSGTCSKIPQVIFKVQIELRIILSVVYPTYLPQNGQSLIGSLEPTNQHAETKPNQYESKTKVKQLCCLT